LTIIYKYLCFTLCIYTHNRNAPHTNKRHPVYCRLADERNPVGIKNIATNFRILHIWPHPLAPTDSSPPASRCLLGASSATVLTTQLLQRPVLTALKLSPCGCFMFCKEKPNFSFNMFRTYTRLYTITVQYY
jgi:hypothetical protein